VRSVFYIYTDPDYRIAQNAVSVAFTLGKYAAQLSITDKDVVDPFDFWCQSGAYLFQRSTYGNSRRTGQNIRTLCVYVRVE
jgi:hypothetical protein